MTRIPDTLAALAVPIKSLRPFKGNPRVGDLELIRESLKTNGQYRPIVVRKATNEVLAGNHTWLAAVELGWEEIAATFVDADAEQARRIVLVDNRANDRAGYDDEALARLLQAVKALEGTGWKPGDLDKLLDSLARSGEDAGRDTEPMPTPTTPTAKRGDLWRLGEHRLICGDATSPEDVARLFAGELAEMVWTDPPYGVDYHGRQGGGEGDAFYGAGGATLQGDDLEAARLRELVREALEHAWENTRAGGAIYLAHPASSTTIREAAIAAGWQLRQELVWVKQHFVLGRQDYAWQHEPILYGWKPGAGHRWNGGTAEATVRDEEPNPRELDKRELIALVRRLRNERHTDVTRADRPARSDLHPTMKPIDLVAEHIANSSRRGELVYDPFGGSGSTLIACENLSRRTYLAELEPRYADVIVDRWQRHTGDQAELERRRRRTRAAV